VLSVCIVGIENRKEKNSEGRDEERFGLPLYGWKGGSGVGETTWAFCNISYRLVST
jgi:hypothetical protein